VGAGSSGPVAVWVGYVPGAGRGVFAVLDIAVGDLIHTADPVVAHPALASLQKGWFNLFTITSPRCNVITHTSCDVVGFSV